MHRKSVYILVLAVATLVVVGIVMLFSTSAFTEDHGTDRTYYLRHQAVWIGIGLVACIAGASIDYHFWQRSWWVWMALSCVLLALCFVPHIGLRINNSSRWINLRAATFQPSELGKLAIVVFLASWFARIGPESRRLLKGFMVPLCAIALPTALIAREIDLGTTALICGTTFLVMFVAGTGVQYISGLAFCGVGGIFFAAMHIKERHGRLMAFMDPQKTKEGVGLQQWQALIAFGSGGVEGLGLGNGREKMMYMPFAHTDFILPIIGEELGLRMTLGIVLLYILIILCGTIISIRSRDRFGMLLGFGLVAIIALQAAVNIAVTTDLMPNKGLVLPFISYGGSNLLFCLLAVGILVNIYRQGVGDLGDKSSTRLQARITPRI